MRLHKSATSAQLHYNSQAPGEGWLVDCVKGRQPLQGGGVSLNVKKDTSCRMMRVCSVRPANLEDTRGNPARHLLVECFSPVRHLAKVAGLNQMLVCRIMVVFARFVVLVGLQIVCQRALVVECTETDISQDTTPRGL